MNGLEELEWKETNWYNLLRSPEYLLARGTYIEGALTNGSYYSRLAESRAELSPNGSLTIYSYQDKDEGSYWCHSKHRSAWSVLFPFSKYLCNC